jgi:cyclic pyranopterin phosphate synthase
MDPFGRHVSYLRVSVTDRCDFRCVYCMSEDMTFLPKQDLLSLEELDRLCSAFVARGTRKIRITGGEPLVRRGIMTLFRSLSRHLVSGALEEVTVTARKRSENLQDVPLPPPNGPKLGLVLRDPRTYGVNFNARF